MTLNAYLKFTHWAEIPRIEDCDLKELPQENLAKLIEQIRQELSYCEDPKDLIIWLADILNVNLE